MKLDVNRDAAKRVEKKVRAPEPKRKTRADAGIVVGIDVGGTFTDLILMDPAGGALRVAKVPTTVENQAFGVLAALDSTGVPLADVATIIHGTTATTRRQAAADGGNTMTQSATGTFGTVPASFTPPTTFTADVGPIARLYQ